MSPLQSTNNRTINNFDNTVTSVNYYGLQSKIYAPNFQVQAEPKLYKVLRSAQIFKQPINCQFTGSPTLKSKKLQWAEHVA